MIYMNVGPRMGRLFHFHGGFLYSRGSCDTSNMILQNTEGNDITRRSNWQCDKI
jgi:hypothetical protein